MPSLHYQGPKYFHLEVDAVFNKIKEYLSRKDDLHLLVGTIERITATQKELHIVGDSETNALMDHALEAIIVAGGDTESDMDFESAKIWRKEIYEEARILPVKTYADYNVFLDAVIISPEPLFRYLIAISVSLEHAVATQDPEYIEQYVNDLHYPFYLAKSFALWNFGDTSPHIELQYLFRQHGISYDKARDGKFSFETFLQRKQKKKDPALSRTLVIAEKMRQFGIYNVEAHAAAAFAGATMFPAPGLEHFVVRREQTNTIEKQLLALVDEDHSKLLPMMKEKIEESYWSECPVFPLLGIKI